MHAGMVTSDELRLNLRREHAANTLCKTCTAFEVSALECLGLFMSLFRVRERKAFSNPCERRKMYLPHFKDRPLLDNFL